MVKGNIQERLADSLATCLKIAEGVAMVEIVGKEEETIIFSENFACPTHGAVMEELSPRLFSFNSPYGACGHCHGLGSLKQFSPDLIVPDPDAMVLRAIAPWADKENPYYTSLLEYVATEYGFKLSDKWHTLTEKQQHIILHGDKEIQQIQYGYYRGVIPMLEKNLSRK